MCSLKEVCKFHHSPRNFVDSSTGRGVSLILIMGGVSGLCVRLQWNVQLYFLWAANLNTFFVARFCMAFIACCRCLSMVSRERPRKQIARSSTKNALKMSMAIRDGSSLISSTLVIYTRVLGTRAVSMNDTKCQLGSSGKMIEASLNISLYRYHFTKDISYLRKKVTRLMSSK